MNCYELFKIFEKHNLKLAKKKDVDYMKEIYSQTELFDISDVYSSYTCSEEINENIALPFKSCFILTNNYKMTPEALYLHNYNKDVLTGSWFNLTIFEDKIFETNIPFTFDIKAMQISLEKDLLRNTFNTIFQYIRTSKMTTRKMAYLKNFIHDDLDFKDIKKKLKNIDLIFETTPEISVFERCIESLQIINSKTDVHSHYTDKTNKSEFYSFKNKPTIKVPSRTIYIYLNKNTNANKIKPITKLEYCHSFKVRGHWRKLNNETLGKDRNGNYDVKGYTWVNDFTKGKGELIHKIRKIK